jgi:hypothetical protein
MMCRVMQLATESSNETYIYCISSMHIRTWAERKLEMFVSRTLCVRARKLELNALMGIVS